MSAFDDLVPIAARVLGAGWFLALNVGITVAWLALGPVFDWSELWQLTYVTTISITTWWAAILIQGAQARDTDAIQAKLDELVRSQPGASDAVAGVEDRP